MQLVSVTTHVIFLYYRDELMPSPSGSVRLSNVNNIHGVKYDSTPEIAKTESADELNRKRVRVSKLINLHRHRRSDI